MRFQSLGVAFIFNIPHSYCLVVRHADDVFAAGVKQQASDPVVMTDLAADATIYTHVLWSLAVFTPHLLLTYIIKHSLLIYSLPILAFILGQPYSTSIQQQLLFPQDEAVQTICCDQGSALALMWHTKA